MVKKPSKIVDFGPKLSFIATAFICEKIDAVCKFEKIIVHGHTPENDIINFPYRINIDTGCFFSGKLSCVCLNDNNNERKFIYS